MKKPVFVMLFLLQAGVSFAQLTGASSFEFLNLPIGSRVAGLGGVTVSATDADVNLFLSNPALLDTANSNFVSWSRLGYYAGVSYNTFAYSRTFDRWGTFGLGVQYLGYGDMARYDPSGMAQGSFSAGETAVVLGYSRQISLFTLGANVKYVQSTLDTYQSSALMFDIGGTFVHPKQELSVGILFKNMGVLMSDYSSTDTPTLPTDLQIGITFKPVHMPFRFTLTGYNLLDYKNVYNSEINNASNSEPSVVDQFFRHINIGMEIVLGDNFNLRAGYNHRVRKELRIEEKAGFGGISLGFMARVKAFEFSYTYTAIHVQGGGNYFTITSNLNRVFNKKSII